MNTPSNDPNPLRELPPISVPSALMGSVELRAVRLLAAHPAPKPRRNARAVLVNFGLTSFCVANVVWCAHVVGLIP